MCNRTTLETAEALEAACCAHLANPTPATEAALLPLLTALGTALEDDPEDAAAFGDFLAAARCLFHYGDATGLAGFLEL